MEGPHGDPDAGLGLLRSGGRPMLHHRQRISRSSARQRTVMKVRDRLKISGYSSSVYGRLVDGQCLALDTWALRMAEAALPRARRWSPKVCTISTCTSAGSVLRMDIDQIRCPRFGNDVHVHCYPERHPRGESGVPLVVRGASTSAQQPSAARRGAFCRCSWRANCGGMEDGRARGPARRGTAAKRGAADPRADPGSA